MKLYLMQHGQALSKQDDPERPLSREGVEQIKWTAKAVHRLGLNFDLVICSPKRRAHQTAALVCEKIRYPYSDIRELDVVLPDHEPKELLKHLDRFDGENLLIVGHLPHLSRLTSRLLGRDGDTVRFENGGLLCIELLPEGNLLTSMLTPDQLRLIAGG
ncbi:MAG: phosphohistidine phosphatase SixA [Desulfuromonas sp.]|nr:MAG: phosphohistidine phosphatase SixA [Desulfuromonas sp.]